MRAAAGCCRQPHQCCPAARRRVSGSTAHQASLVELLWGPKGAADAPPATRGGAGLPPPEQAQGLSVVRLPNFLSETEIAQVIEGAAGIRRDGAGAVRLQSEDETKPDGSLPSWDAQGYDSNRGEWSTTYLHTLHLFQNRLPDLHGKIVKVGQRTPALSPHLLVFSYVFG